MSSMQQQLRAADNDTQHSNISVETAVEDSLDVIMEFYFLKSGRFGGQAGILWAKFQSRVLASSGVNARGQIFSASPCRFLSS